MAFRQPAAPPARLVSAPEPQGAGADTLSSAQPKSLERSHEWVLFSPSQTQSFSQTKSILTERTPRSAGLSRLSDFGSLNTLARSGQNDGDILEDAEDAAGEDEDLDSLDEGLHAFQEPSLYHIPRYVDPSGSILPTHDGLGTFQPSSSQAQEQMWQFEKYESHKRRAGHARRTSSVQRHLDAVADSDAAKVENERMARIETWRMEQSKILLERIEKEARRRRMSESSGRVEGDVSTSANAKGVQTSRLSDTNPPDHIDTKKAESETEGESLCDRITWRVIRDILGIDEALLSVIFGESLPEEDTKSIDSSIVASGLADDLRDSTSSSATWDTRLLERIARELGILLQHLTDHPGAFSAPSFNSTNLDYAGIPVTDPPPQIQPGPSASPLSAASGSMSPHFNPTLETYQSRPSTSASDTTHAALWGIEEESPSSSPAVAQGRDYWERAPDFGGIFRVLHHRFSSPQPPPTSTPSIATTATPASLYRTAMIRQHHPLVSRAATTASMRRSNRNAAGILHPRHYRRTESICKSLSVRKGGRGGSGSSRN